MIQNECIIIIFKVILINFLKNIFRSSNPHSIMPQKKAIRTSLVHVFGSFSHSRFTNTDLEIFITFLSNDILQKDQIDVLGQQEDILYCLFTYISNERRLKQISGCVRITQK